MQILPFKAVYPNYDYLSSPASFFATVKEEYDDYYRSGFFLSHSQKAIYVYQITRGEQCSTGIIAGVHISEYLNHNLKRHEDTIADKEQKQIQLLLKRKASVKPVLLTYPTVEEIDDFLSHWVATQPVFFEIPIPEKQEVHRFWTIENEADVARIQQLFDQQVACTYIADGHHRSSAMATLYHKLHSRRPQAFELLLCALFPASQIKIWDYNRVLDDLNGVSPTRFMAGLSTVADILPRWAPFKPERVHQLAMCIHREWYELNWKPAVLEDYQTKGVILDVQLLDEKILRDLLGIADVRREPGITYIEGPQGLEGIRRKLVHSDNGVAFCLYPVAFGDFVQMAESDQIMPPKSTWFEPRLVNGILAYDFHHELQ